MKHRFYVAAAITAVLAGCSGSQPEDCKIFTRCSTGGPVGGGGTGLLTVTQDNALDSLREAWLGASISADMPALLVATNVGDTSGGVVFAGKLSSRPTPFLDPYGPTTYNCPTSGTFTVTGDVTDQNTLTPGDFAVYESSACDSGTGFTVDGTHRIDIDSIVGDPNSGQYEHGQTLNFTNFVASGQNVVTTVNGDHSAVIDTTSALQTSVLFSGDSLAVDEDQATVTVQNFGGLATVENSAPFEYELDVTGTGSSSLVQGSFDYFTTETMVIPLGEAPTDGHFNIRGNGGSTARVVIFDPTTVRIQVDANGSSNYELSVDMSWEEFLAGSVPLTAANNTGTPD